MSTSNIPMDKDGVRTVIKQLREKSRSLYDELGEYRKNHPPLDETVIHELDPEKSIAWNKEEAKRLNRSRSSAISAYKTKLNQCDTAVTQAMMDYIRDEYGFEGAVAEKIYEIQTHLCGSIFLRCKGCPAYLVSSCMPHISASFSCDFRILSGSSRMMDHNPVEMSV